MPKIKPVVSPANYGEESEQSRLQAGSSENSPALAFDIPILSSKSGVRLSALPSQTLSPKVMMEVQDLDQDLEQGINGPDNNNDEDALFFNANDSHDDDPDDIELVPVSSPAHTRNDPNPKEDIIRETQMISPKSSQLSHLQDSKVGSTPKNRQQQRVSFGAPNADALPLNEEQRIKPRLILEQSTMRLKEKTEAEDNYINLVQYLLFLVLYLFVLSYQKNSFDEGAQNLHEILKGNIFSEGGGTFTVFGTSPLCSSPSDNAKPFCDGGEYVGDSIEYSGDLFEAEVRQTIFCATDNLLCDRQSFVRQTIFCATDNLLCDRQPFVRQTTFCAPLAAARCRSLASFLSAPDSINSTPCRSCSTRMSS